MRPERKREHLESTGLARARMYLKAHLSWLDGWPVSQSAEKIEWQTRPSVGNGFGERIIIDRERLRQTQSIFLKLISKFPRALPRIVGDVNEWQQRVTSTLDRLKHAVHHGENLLAETAVPWDTLPRESSAQLRQLRRDWPSLSELVHALVWSSTVWTDHLPDLIEQLNEQHEALATLTSLPTDPTGMSIAFLLMDLGRLDGREVIAFPLAILGHASRRTVASDGLQHNADEWVRILKKARSRASLPDKPLRPEGSIGIETIKHVKWLCRQKRSVRQRAASLINLLSLETILDEWSEAWTTFIDESHRTLRHLHDFGKLSFQNDFVREIHRVANELHEQWQFQLIELQFELILHDIRYISESGATGHIDALGRLLNAIPIHGAPCLTSAEGRRLRLIMRHEVALRIRHTYYAKPQARYLLLTARYFEQHADQEWCAIPWQGLIEAPINGSYYWQSPLDTLLGYLDEESRWPMFFEAIERLAAHSDYRFQHNIDVARLCAITNDAATVCDRFNALVAANLLGDLDHRQFAAAIALECDGVSFVELCHLVKPMFEQYREIGDSLPTLAAHFREAGWPRLLASLLRQKRTAEVTRIAAQCAALGSTIPWPRPLTCPSEPLLPEWSRSLPAEWHRAIATLCHLISESPASESTGDIHGRDARRTIERLLGDVSPNRERLGREIAALEQRVAAGTSTQPIEIRLANLRQRRDNPMPISASVITKIQQKLDDALFRFVFDDLRRRLEATLTGLLTEKTGNRLIARQMTSPQHLELIRALLNLPEPYRSLGLRLLKKRWCGIDWVLQDEPANRAFIETLAARGVDVAPWLSSDVLRVATDTSGRTITMRFESDEVERLLMGYHFDTCLSTDGVNFFSAVANAVDINKRVLYARDATQQVIGRCLFALGDAGSILTFHPYCHESSDSFPFHEHVGVIASELARRMNTLVSSSDRVSSLVAPDWYNDGPLNQGDSINLPDSPLRRFLATATEETLLAGLEQALEPLGLTHTALALIIELPDFEERPELVRPLLPLLHQHEARFEPTTLGVVAHLARKANEHESAARTLTPRFTNWLQREVRRFGTDHWPSSRCLELLAEYRPVLLLNILRQTRNRRIRDDLEELEISRLELLQRCHERLGRSNLAAQLKQKLNRIK